MDRDEASQEPGNVLQQVLCQRQILDYAGMSSLENLKTAHKPREGEGESS